MDVLMSGEVEKSTFVSASADALSEQNVFGLIHHAWSRLNLPMENMTMENVDVSTYTECFPSSFRVGDLAQVTITLAAMTAAQYWSIRQGRSFPRVAVETEHACVEFMSERLYVLNGKAAPTWTMSIGGLHKSKDGYIRMHDSFPNHREHALKILGLKTGASRSAVAEQVKKWRSIDLENAAFREGAVMVALRSPEEWQELPAARGLPDFPVKIDSIFPGNPYMPSIPASIQDNKCLRGIRVVEMSRVIAAPVAGRTLATHGADVIWITSPNLPDLPDLDIDLSRGKRTVQLDIKQPREKQTLLNLIRSADVFIQSYRPGSLAAQGLSPEVLAKINPNIIVANLNAYGTEGPWARYRGFDSIVQTCSGINVADARAYGANEPAHVLPCQALDHGSGYFLASGIMAALCHRATHGGSYNVHVSLAGVMKYLTTLGRYPDKSGFDRKDFSTRQAFDHYLETRETGFGELRAVRHSAKIDGLNVGWDEMPKPLGSDAPIWL